MEEGKGERYLASGRQYGNALLGVRHQEEDCSTGVIVVVIVYIARLSAKALNNEFFTKACIDWRKRLTNGSSFIIYQLNINILYR